MKTLLTAVLVGLLSLSASRAFADGCEKRMSPSGPQPLMSPGESVIEVALAVTRVRAYIKNYIQNYRAIGGELYWKHQKLQGRYARYVNQEFFRVRSALLGEMGTEMRGYLSLRKEVLTPEMKESIQDALEDYGNLELHEEPAPAQ